MYFILDELLRDSKETAGKRKKKCRQFSHQFSGTQMRAHYARMPMQLAVTNGYHPCWFLMIVLYLVIEEAAVMDQRPGRTTRESVIETEAK